MSNLRLVYFDVKGRGFPIRMALTIGNIPFEDKRIRMEDWPSFKPTTVTGHVPFLEVDSKILTQTSAILDYVALRANLLPSDPFQNARVHEIVQIRYGEINDHNREALYEKNPTKRLEMEKNLALNVLPKYFQRFDDILKQEGSEKFAIGTKLSLADLAIFDLVLFIKSAVLEGIPQDLCDKYANIMKVYNHVKDIPEIKKCVDLEAEYESKRNQKKIKLQFRLFEIFLFLEKLNRFSLLENITTVTFFFIVIENFFVKTFILHMRKK